MKIHYNLWHTTKAVLTGKCRTFSAYVRKKRKIKLITYGSTLRNWEKREQKKPKVNRKKNKDVENREVVMVMHKGRPYVYPHGLAVLLIGTYLRVMRLYVHKRLVQECS